LTWWRLGEDDFKGWRSGGFNIAKTAGELVSVHLGNRSAKRGSAFRGGFCEASPSVGPISAADREVTAGAS